jgi:Tfp pilus assembly protein PilO
MNTGARKNREKLLAVITAVVIFGALIFNVIINPQLKERKQRIERIGRLQLKLAKMQGDLLIKDRIDGIYSQVEPLIAGAGTDQQEISLFTRQMSDLYSVPNVKIRSVKILPGVKETFYRRLSIKIEMSGHIKEVLKFIFAIETYPKPVRIEQLELKAQENKDNVQVSLLISKVVSGQNTG